MVTFIEYKAKSERAQSETPSEVWVPGQALETAKRDAMRDITRAEEARSSEQRSMSVKGCLSLMGAIFARTDPVYSGRNYSL